MKPMIKLLLVLTSLLFIACSGTTNYDNSTLSKLEKQINEELKAITETYSESNHGFIYNVFENDTAQIQVIHSSFIPELKTTNAEFGLAIAISFDETFREEIENHKKFRSSKYFANFTAYEWDGIPCYGINMKTDYEATAIMLTGILKDIYGFNESTDFSTDFYDQGAL